MAQFIMAKLHSGPQVWINVDQVRFVSSQDDHVSSQDDHVTTVHFDEEDSIAVEGPPAVVVRAARE
jgi:hypothetical protein